MTTAPCWTLPDWLPACHAQGALLLLDVSQACGAVPMNVNDLGRRFYGCVLPTNGC